MGEYRDISTLYDTDVTVGYDDCQEFMDYDDMGDPERGYDIVLGIRKN